MATRYHVTLSSYWILYHIISKLAGTAPPGRTRKHWFAAPYPSSFHYHEGIKELPWELPGSQPPVVNILPYSGSRLLLSTAEREDSKNSGISSNYSVNYFDKLVLGDSLSASEHRALLSSSSDSGDSNLDKSRTRDILSLFIGSVKTAQASSRALRTALYNQVIHIFLL